MRLQGKTRNISCLILIILILPFAWVSLNTSTGSNELLVDSQLSELKTRLRHAETMNQERELDLQKLRNQLNILLNSQANGNRSQPGSYIPAKAQEILSNLSLGNDVRPPNIYYYLPHLVKNPSGLEPAVRLSQGRTGVSVVIGIPHVKRETTNYLYVTLNSLFSGLSDVEKGDCLFVVFIGEITEPDYINSISTDLKTRFPAEMETGLLEVLVPPQAYYPDFSSLKLTFGDPIERVKWRTKQNLDFTFLMMYARTRGTYYLQLEDDIECKPGYLTVIKSFVSNQQNDEWVLLEFSHLGFIGKLFKSSDLPMIVEFFLMFHRDKPIDWLLDHLLFVKVCNPEKDNKHCERSVEELRRRYKPSLFQHIGMHSSLKGKIQKLKDRDFGQNGPPAPPHVPQLLPHAKLHTNPPAQVSTTLNIYQMFTIDQAYRGDGIFWCTLPHAEDTITITFTPPIAISSFTFTSGNPEHPGDKFYNTSVELLLVKKNEVLDNKVVDTRGYMLLPDGFLRVGWFDHNTGQAVGQLDALLGEVETLRLHVHADSAAWVILSEITINPVKTGEQAVTTKVP